MSVTPFVDEVLQACEAALARREPCTVVAIVFGQGEAERVAQWARTEAGRLGAVYELALPHAFDVGVVRVRVVGWAEVARALPTFPRRCIVVVDQATRMHAELEGVWPTLRDLVVACEG